jgi:hypothetical protein
MSTFIEAIPIEPPRHITKYAFSMRLTSTERKAIRAAAKVNEDVEDFQELFNLATFIDLDLEDGIAAKLTMLEEAGLLDEGRADEILSAPVQDHERWEG